MVWCWCVVQIDEVLVGDVVSYGIHVWYGRELLGGAVCWALVSGAVWWHAEALEVVVQCAGYVWAMQCGVLLGRAVMR